MERSPDMFSAIEAELARFDGDGVTLPAWRRACPTLAAADVSTVSQLPGWVWGLSRPEADHVIAALIRQAQAGDQAALLAVVICLRPGLLTMARRMPVTVNDVITEATIRILDYPVDRRRNIAGGLILDIRQAIWAPACRRPQIEAVATDPSELTSPTSSGHNTSPDEQLMVLILESWEDGHLDADNARLIIETRVLGHPMQTIAEQRSINRKALYARRERAEHRLASTHDPSAA